MKTYGETIGYIIYSDGRKQVAVHGTHGTDPGAYQAAEQSITRDTIRKFEYEERNWTMGPKPVRWTIERH